MSTGQDTSEHARASTYDEYELDEEADEAHEDEPKGSLACNLVELCRRVQEAGSGG